MVRWGLASGNWVKGRPNWTDLGWWQQDVVLGSGATRTTTQRSVARCELLGKGTTARVGCGTGDGGRGLYRSFQFGVLSGGFLNGELEVQ